MDEEDKTEWNRKAKEVSAEPEQEEKKRKRIKSDDENENTTNVINQAKKPKEAVTSTNSASSKLFGFEYTKNALLKT